MRIARLDTNCSHILAADCKQHTMGTVMIFWLLDAMLGLVATVGQDETVETQRRAALVDMRIVTKWTSINWTNRVPFL